MPTSRNNTANNVPDTSNVRWQFIDSSNNSRTNLTQVKRHVMQEYMRQKKGGTRQSEREEQPRAKRGRPRKTHVAKETSERKAKADGDNNCDQPRVMRSTRKQYTRKEDLILKINCDMFGSTPISSNPPLIESNDMSSFPHFQSPSSQSHDIPLQLDGFVDLYPQNPPSHDLYFNNFSWSSPSAMPYQFMESPISVMSDARIDPFDTLPMELDRDDSYMNGIPAYFYGSNHWSPMAHNSYVLMTLNAAMWDYRNTPARAAIFLDTFEKSMVDYEVRMSGSMETMLRISLECRNGTTDGWCTNANGFAPPAPIEEPPDFS
ncbi:unnamed protein product [Penicillium glandicola]